MKIIIVGCGKVGETLAAVLSQEDNEITVIDRNEAVVERVCSQYDVMGTVGDGVSFSTQNEADIAHTDLLIAVTGADEMNLLCCLIARKAGHCQTIARVRNPRYSKEISFLKEELGLAMVINPEEAAAQEIARILRFPSAIEIDVFAKGRVELLRFKIPKESAIDGLNLVDMHAKLKCRVLVCTVERGGEVFIPRGEFTLSAGDVISIIASPEDEMQFFRKAGMPMTQIKKVMIVGGGEISFYLTEQLLKAGMRVKVIEKDIERCDQLWDTFPKATVVHGDGTDRHLLEEEGIDQTDGFVALTSTDEENVILSLYARRMGCVKLVTKINRYVFEDVLESLELDSLICPRDITAERILQYVRAMNNSMDSNVETLHQIVDRKVEALEFIIRDGFRMSDTPIRELPLRQDVLLACISRDGKVILPRGDDCLQTGDSVIVVTTRKGLGDINDIFA